MFVPFGTDRPLRRRTVVTWWLIGASVASFLAQMLVSGSDPGAAWLGANFVLVPGRSAIWTYLTYQFMHAGLLHLLGNMIFLWAFGPNVEDRIGKGGFVAFYLIGGAAAGLAHALVSSAPVVGASGSIAAVTGAYLVLFPRTNIRALLWLGIITPITIPATWFIGLAVGKDILLHTMGGTNIATAAHLGGYAFGALVALTLLWTHILSREPYDLFTLLRQGRRRRSFRRATETAPVWAHEQAPAPQRKRVPEDEAKMERLRALRAKIDAAVERSDAAVAESLYRDLLAQEAGATLSRKRQLDLANLLFREDRREAAAEAYDLYLQRFGASDGDGESPRVRLMLALLCARTLNDPVRAEQLIREAKPRLRRDDERQLADALLDEIGAPRRD